MTVVPSLVAMTIAVSSLQKPLELPEEFTLTVLGGSDEHLVSGRAVKLVGRRLIARLSEHLQPDTCFRINCDDAILPGETLGCWREGDAIFAALDVQQALAPLGELAMITHAPSHAPRSLRQSA